MNGFKTWARWLAVIPGSVVVGLLSTFPIHWFVMLYKFFPGSGDSLLQNEHGESFLKSMEAADLERMGYALIVPAVMIVSSSYIAPKRKFATALVFSSGLALCIAFAVILTLRQNAALLSSNSVSLGITASLWVASICFAIFVSYHKFYGKEASVNVKQNTLLNSFESVAFPLLVKGYRSISEKQSCAPTGRTSDQEIVDTYMKVGSAFREAAEARGEELPAGIINFIVWKFLQVLEMGNADLLDQHLKYEIKKYLSEGLREDYRKDLQLF